MAFSVTHMDAAVSAESAPATLERRARAFAAARRHSRVVKLLRVALKLGAVGAIVAGVFSGVFSHFEKSVDGFSTGSLGIEGTKVTMDSPKLTGYRKDGRPYLVNAAKALQDALHPTIVELVNIDADFATADSVTVKLTAKTGTYDTAAQHLDVADEVRLKSSQYDVTMNSASIDFKNGLYVSDEPVKIVTTNGMTVEADSFNGSDSGRDLNFVGNVRSVLAPAPAPDEAPQESAKDGAAP